MKQKAIIFDLDGTLIDSLEDIALCMNKVLKQLNLPTYEIDKYRDFVGGGIDTLVQKALGEYSEELKEKVKENFKKIYDSKLYEQTKAYDGIYELLEKLQSNGFKIAVLSNKPHEFTCKYVDALFSKYKIQEVHGQKSNINKKPDPSAALNIAKALDVKCENTYFVGDTNVDMQTASNANMKSIGVLWGFRPNEVKSLADFVVNHPLEILEIVKG